MSFVKKITTNLVSKLYVCHQHFGNETNEEDHISRKLELACSKLVKSTKKIINDRSGILIEL